MGRETGFEPKIKTTKNHKTPYKGVLKIMIGVF